jgi:2-dehydropantoate 2-reductase
MAGGSILYNLNRDKKLNDPIRFTDYALMTTFDEVGTKEWHQIYLCFSSTALRSFDFPGFSRHLKGTPTIVMLQPSAEDFEVLTKTFPPEQIVEGMITLISYLAPLSTEQADPPGIAYWFPPMMPTPFSGEAKRRDDVIQSFKAGKIKSAKSKNVRLDALFPSAFLATFLTALEYSDWNFKKMKGDPKLLNQLQQAVGEVFAALASRHNTRAPWPAKAINQPWIYKILLALAPRVMPMDIETYFEYHFTKVNDQTKLYMKTYLETAIKEGTGHEMLEVFNGMT